MSRAAVQATLLEKGATKQAIASRLAQIFPELLPHLPPERKPWMTEDDRMSVFDAVSFAVTSIAGHALPTV